MASFRTVTAGDPKLWPSWIKICCLGNVCFYAFLGNCYAAGITSGFAQLAKEFHSGFGPLTDLVSYIVLALGVSNLFWMPIAMCVGKRPTILISMVVFTAGAIWTFKAQSLNSLLGARIMAGFGAGSVEALGPSIIADLYFERYFATAMAAFALFLSSGSQIGPVISGYSMADRGWRWFFILCTILGVINFVACALFLPETTYLRTYAHNATAAEADKETEAKHEEHIEEIPKSADDSQVFITGTIRPYAGSYWKDLVSFRGRGQEERGLWGLPRQFSLPFRFMGIPAAIYATLSYGAFLGGVVIISGQIPGFFTAPPYLFDSKAIGLLNLSSMLGIFIAYPIAGPLTDLVSRTLDRANNGIHRPEHRLPALLAPALLTPWGLILFSNTIANKGSVYVSAVGFASQVSGLAFVPSVVLSYLVDSYPRDSGEALVLVNAGKNMVAFLLAKVNQEWLANGGLKKMYSEVAAIQWAIIVLAVPLYFAGPWLKAKTMRFL